MKILINDIMQYDTTAPALVKTPALADIYTDSDSFPATFASAKTINCLGIGYTDATQVQITNDTDTITVNITKSAPYHNGLYLINSITTKAVAHTFTVSHNGTYIGRVGMGTHRTLGTNPTKEIGFYSTQENRVTNSGQVIPGAGGYSGRRFEADVRYKIDSDIYDDIEAAYEPQISRLWPYFLCIDNEQHKVPTNMYYFYASTDKPLSLLQSSSYRFLYSYKFSFRERF